jgi:hypothetical protein
MGTTANQASPLHRSEWLLFGTRNVSVLIKKAFIAGGRGFARCARVPQRSRALGGDTYKRASGYRGSQVRSGAFSTICSAEAWGYRCLCAALPRNVPAGKARKTSLLHVGKPEGRNRLAIGCSSQRTAIKKSSINTDTRIWQAHSVQTLEGPNTIRDTKQVTSCSLMYVRTREFLKIFSGANRATGAPAWALDVCEIE